MTLVSSTLIAMIIPNQLKIGGHLFRVVRADLPDRNGETDYAGRTITLDKDLVGSSADATLIHEAMHVMNSTLEHALLDSLAEQIYQLLADNGLLAANPPT